MALTAAELYKIAEQPQRWYQGASPPGTAAYTLNARPVTVIEPAQKDYTGAVIQPIQPDITGGQNPEWANDREERRNLLFNRCSEIVHHEHEYNDEDRAWAKEQLQNIVKDIESTPGDNPRYYANAVAYLGRL